MICRILYGSSGSGFRIPNAHWTPPTTGACRFSRLPESSPPHRGPAAPSPAATSRRLRGAAPSAATNGPARNSQHEQQVQTREMMASDMPRAKKHRVRHFMKQKTAGKNHVPTIHPSCIERAAGSERLGTLKALGPGRTRVELAENRKGHPKVCGS